MNEIWKDIKYYEDFYQISNLGRVKSLARKDNRGWQLKEKILKQSIFSGGYYTVHLHKHGKGKTFLVHRLIALAFIENKNVLPEIHHKDGNKLNNSLANLEWCTRSQNLKHAFAIGLTHPSRPKGTKMTEKEKINFYTYDRATANKIREDYKTGKYSHRKLAAKYNIGKSSVGDIILNKRFT